VENDANNKLKHDYINDKPVVKSSNLLQASKLGLLGKDNKSLVEFMI